MLRKWFTFAALGVLSAGALLSTGCSSSGNKPYGLTGNTDSADRQRWTDSRGYYRADWKNGINTPPGYPR